MSKTAEKQALALDTIPRFSDPILDNLEADDELEELYTGPEHDKTLTMADIKRINTEPKVRFDPRGKSLKEIEAVLDGM